MNRVLLIDDNSVSREAFHRLLSSMGFSVMTSTSDEAARAIEAVPDFIVLCSADEAERHARQCAGAWVYRIGSTGTMELCSAASGKINENGLFWHRRLLRAMNISTHKRTVVSVS